MSGHLGRIVDGLDYDFGCFDLGHFIDHIARRQRREIIVAAVDFAPELSAAWVRGETADYIFYNASAHSVHQMHSILHELGHIILGHSCQPIERLLPPELVSELAASNAGGRLRASGQPCEDAQEQEAEAFVYAIQQRLVPARRIQTLMGRSSSIESLRRWVDGMAFEV